MGQKCKSTKVQCFEIVKFGEPNYIVRNCRSVYAAMKGIEKYQARRKQAIEDICPRIVEKISTQVDILYFGWKLGNGSDHIMGKVDGLEM